MLNIKESDLRKTLEEIGIPQGKIDEVVKSLPKNAAEEAQQIKELADRGIYVQTLREALEMETEPIKKSIIAARIISAGLE